MALGLDNLLTVADGQRGAKHERLEKHLRGELSAGRLLPGQALPTEIEMANMLGVARNTVRQALASLEREGFVHRVRGKGTFVDERVQQRIFSAGSNALSAFGLVLPEIHTGFYPSLQSGFSEAAAKTHNQMIVCDTGNDLHRQADSILQLIDKRVSGVGIVPVTIGSTPAHQIRTLQDQGIPVVFCHRGVSGIDAPLVSFSGVQVGRVGGEAIAALGHRRVAYFASHSFSLSQGYLVGFAEALGKCKGEVPDEFAYFGKCVSGRVDADFEQEMMAALEQMFSSVNPPTAILASFDPLAEVIYLLLGRLGFRVPEDVSVVGFGGAKRDGAILHKLTSVVVDEVQTGIQTVELITEIQSGKRDIRDNQQIEMPLSLSKGQTLGPVPR